MLSLQDYIYKIVDKLSVFLYAFSTNLAIFECSKVFGRLLLLMFNLGKLNLISVKREILSKKGVKSSYL